MLVISRFRSSAAPKKVDLLWECMQWGEFSRPYHRNDKLESLVLMPLCYVFCSVACGLSHSMVIVNRTDITDRLEQAS